jgi:hypothetical protein
VTFICVIDQPARLKAGEFTLSDVHPATLPAGKTFRADINNALGNASVRFGIINQSPRETTAVTAATVNETKGHAMLGIFAPNTQRETVNFRRFGIDGNVRRQGRLKKRLVRLHKGGAGNS